MLSIYFHIKAVDKLNFSSIHIVLHWSKIVSSCLSYHLISLALSMTTTVSIASMCRDGSKSVCDPKADHSPKSPPSAPISLGCLSSLLALLGYFWVIFLSAQLYFTQCLKPMLRWSDISFLRIHVRSKSSIFFKFKLQRP